MLDSEVIKTGVDFGTDIINLLDTAHGKVIALVAAVKLMAKFKGFSLKGIGTSLVDSIKQVSIAQQSLANLTSNPATKLGQSFDPTNVNLYAAAVSNLTAKQQANLLASTGLSKAQIQLALQYNGLSDDAIREATAHVFVKQAKDQEKLSDQQLLANKILLSAASLKLAGDTDSLAVAEYLEANASELAAAADAKQMIMASSLSDAQKAAALAAIGQANANITLGASIKALFASNPVGMILTIATTILSVAIPAFNYFRQSAERLKEEVKELTDTYEEAKKSFSDNLKTLTISSDTSTYATLEEEFAQLAKGVDAYGNNISLTADQYERYRQICETICGINPSLKAGYDSVTEAIGNNASVLSNLIELQKIQAKQTAQEYVTDENIEKIFKDKKNDLTKAQDKLQAYLESNGANNITGISNLLYQEFDWNNVGTKNYGDASSNADDLAKKILETMGISDVDDKLTEYYNEYGYFQWSWFTKAYADQIAENADVFKNSVISNWAVNWKSAKRDLENAKNSMINTFLQIPFSLDEYDKLQNSSKSFIADWIKNSGLFTIDESTTQEEILTLKAKIRDFVEQIAKNNYSVTLDNNSVITASDILDSIYNFDAANVDWEKYKTEIQNLINLLWQSIGAENNTLGFGDKESLALSLGFDIKITDDQEKKMKARYKEITGKTDDEVEAYFNSLPATTVQRLLKIDWNLVDENNLDDTINPKSQSVTSSKAYSILVTEAEKYKDIIEVLNELTYDNIEISKEQYDALKELIGSEEGFADCIDTSNGYIIKSAALTKKLVDQKKKEHAANVRLAKSQAELQYHDVIRSIASKIKSAKTLADVNEELVDSLFDQANALKMTINQYQLLENSLLGATNAFVQFSKAQETDSQNTYGSTLVEMAQTMYDAIYKTGQVGSEAFWAAVRATVPDDVYMGLVPGDAQIQAISRYLQDNLFSNLTFSGDSFSIDYSSIESFVQKAQSKGLFSGIDTTAFGLSDTFMASLKDGEDALKEFADQMGVTEEYVYAMFSEMDKYNTDGMGLSMLFQLDSSTSGQLTILNTQLEQALATRKRLLEQGGDLSANAEEIKRIQSQQASLKTQIIANTEKYLTTSNALENSTKTVGETLSEELIIEIGLQGKEGQTIESVFQEVSDWLLQLEEPTILDLEISKDSIQDSIDQLERVFTKEGLEANLKILSGEKEGPLTIDETTLRTYEKLLNIDQFIDDALSANLTTTESLLTQIATNTGIMAGTEEAPPKEENTNGSSNDTSNNNQSQDGGLESDQKSEETTSDAKKEIQDVIDTLRQWIASQTKKASSGDSMFVEDRAALNTVNAELVKAVDLMNQLVAGSITADEAMDQLLDIKDKYRIATKAPTEIYLKSQWLEDFDPTKDTDVAVVISPTLPDGTELTPGDLASYVSKLLSGEEIDSDINFKIFEGEDYIEQAQQYAEQIDQGIEATDDLGNSAEEAGKKVDGLLSSGSVPVTNGLYEFKQTAISTYSELQAQVSSYNDLQIKTNEIMTSGTEVTQDYVNSLAALIEDQTALNDCFERVGDKILVKNVDALEELIKVSKKNTANNVELAKSQARLEYYKLVKQLNDTLKGNQQLDSATRDSISTTLSQIDAVEQAIYKYQLLEDSLFGATNAFNEFAKAQEIDSLNTYGDSYVEMVQTMYDALYKTGQVGTEQFQAAVKALIPEDALAGEADRMKAIFDYFNSNIAPTLTLEDDSFTLDYSSIENFVNKALEAKVLLGDVENFDLAEGMDLKTAAELMDMTTTQAYAFFAELDKYNTGTEQSFLSQLDDSGIMNITTKIEELNRKKLALLEDGGYDNNKAKIDEINQELAQNEAELNKLGEEAYNTWQKYTQNDAALEALGAIENKEKALTKEDANVLGLEWDEVQGKTIQETYDLLLAKKLKLEEPTVLTAQLAIQNIDAQIEALKKKLSDSGADPAIFGEARQQIQDQIDALEADKALLSTTFGIEISAEEKEALKDELNAIETFKINDKTFIVTANGASKTIQQLKDIKKYIEQIRSAAIEDIDINLNGGGRVNGTAHLFGTANAHGTSNNGGDWGAPKTETALVGELGPEILVRGNRWMTVGDNGAEFTQVKKGDIIFNHKQTEALLSNGHITGRGKAYASGTAYAGLWNPTDGSGSGSGSGSGGSSGNNAKDQFEEIFDWIEVRLEEINEQLDLRNARLENTTGFAKQNAVVNEMLELNKKLYDNLIAGANKYYEYSSQLLKKIPAEYREAAQDGSIAIEEFVGKTDEKTLEAIKEYREWVQKGADATQQAEEVLTEISNLAKQAIDNISNDFGNQTSLRDSKVDQLDAYNALVETKYGSESENIYKAIIAETNKNIKTLQEQRNKMQAELNAQVKAGNIKKYSQNWYDAVNDIAAVDTEIINLTTDTYNYQDSINELHWDHLDNLLSRFEAISDEADNLIDILGSKDLVDETGNWTKEGITSLGLYAQKMEIAEMQAKKYKDEINYLNKNWKKLGYTEQEYVEKLEELKKGQYDAIKTYNDTKDAIIDLNKERIDAIKDGIQKEIDAYEELINKKKEELDADKDAHDWQKTVAEKQKNISDIERKIAALSADNSASARAQRAKLEAELIEAQAELQETYYDRSITDQQNALDKELENFKENKDKEMEGWDEYLENTEQVVADSLSTVQTNTDAVYQTLKSMGKEYSLSIAESLTSPWKDGETAIQSFSEKFGLSMSSTVEELQRLSDEFKKVMDEIEGYGSKVVDQVDKNEKTYQGNVNAPENSKPGNNTPQQDNGQKEIKTIKVGGKINAGSAKIYSYAGDKTGEKQYYSADPIYTVLGINGEWVQVRHKSLKSGVTGWFKKSDIKAYATGTAGVPKDQLALIDELGEELQLVPDGNGRLAYLRKGTAIIPHDISENLMQLGQLNPQDILDRNRPTISAPHITNNETVINIEYGDVLHIENFNGDKPEDLSKMIDKAFDKHMKDLNQQIRRYAR